MVRAWRARLPGRRQAELQLHQPLVEPPVSLLTGQAIG